MKKYLMSTLMLAGLFGSTFAQTTTAKDTKKVSVKAAVSAKQTAAPAKATTKEAVVSTKQAAVPAKATTKQAVVTTKQAAVPAKATTTQAAVATSAKVKTDKKVAKKLKKDGTPDMRYSENKKG